MFSTDLVEFVQAWEGLKLHASGDPLVAGVRDIGHGHVIRPGETLESVTAEEAEALLVEDLQAMAFELGSRLNDVDLAQHEFDAVLSLAYNVGVNAVRTSTLCRRLRENDKLAAANEFPRWCRAGGQQVLGLLKRRNAEQAMFLRADYSGRP